MQLTITWKCPKKDEIDLMVEGGQRIRDTISVLAESGFISDAEYTFVHSERRSELISTDLSYEEAKILNGDRLILLRV